MEELLVVKRRLNERGKLIILDAFNRQDNFPPRVVKAFSPKRIRINTVYALLVTSILLTIVSAIDTCIEINAIEKNVLPPSGAQFNPTRFLSFLLLAATCGLALITIVRKDKKNYRLLEALRSTNRNLENEVRNRTRAMAEAVRAKDHFLGIATHDLKAPIAGVLGLVELVRIENKNLSNSTAEYLSHIEYSCRKMQRLIHDLLEINRIEQGKSEVRKQNVNLSVLFQKIRLDFAPQAARKNIELVFVGQMDFAIETDHDSLSRILENLISNAIKFSLPEKKVLLRVKPTDTKIIFEIEDHGPGIPPEEQPKLFSKFQRLSNRPTNSESSTGLGLAIVKELTAALGGEISFKSHVGEGSTFIVALPLSLC